MTISTVVKPLAGAKVNDQKAAFLAHLLPLAGMTGDFMFAGASAPDQREWLFDSRFLGMLKEENNY